MDDVLLEIFGYLNPLDLYQVSQCSGRFFGLAQRAFNLSLSGKLTLCDGVDGFEYNQEMLETFGPTACHIELCSLIPYRLVDMWYIVKAEELVTLRIDVFYLALPKPRAVFPKLETLHLYNIIGIGRRDFCINFAQWFPNLKHLIFDDGQYMPYVSDRIPMHSSSPPSPLALTDEELRLFLLINPNLLNLQMRNVESYLRAGELEQILPDAIQTFNYLQGVPDFDLSDYRTHVARLVQLVRKFDYDFTKRIGFYENPSLLKDLTHLQTIRMPIIYLNRHQSAMVDFFTPQRHRGLRHVFVMQVAANVPTTLRELNFYGKIPLFANALVWRAFVEALPPECQFHNDIVEEIAQRFSE